MLKKKNRLLTTNIKHRINRDHRYLSRSLSSRVSLTEKAVKGVRAIVSNNERYQKTAYYRLR